jgi:hypothetical protein
MMNRIFTDLNNVDTVQRSQRSQRSRSMKQNRRSMRMEEDAVLQEIFSLKENPTKENTKDRECLPCLIKPEVKFGLINALR